MATAFQLSELQLLWRLSASCVPRGAAAGCRTSTPAPQARVFDGSATARARAGCTALARIAGRGVVYGSAREFSDGEGLSMADGAIAEAPAPARSQLGGRDASGSASGWTREAREAGEAVGVGNSNATARASRWRRWTRKRTRDAAFIGADRLRTARGRRARTQTHGPGGHENAKGQSMGAACTRAEWPPSDVEQLWLADCESPALLRMRGNKDGLRHDNVIPTPALMLVQIRSLTSAISSARDAKVSEPPAERGRTQSHASHASAHRGSQLDSNWVT